MGLVLFPVTSAPKPKPALRSSSASGSGEKETFVTTNEGVGVDTGDESVVDSGPVTSNSQPNTATNVTKATVAASEPPRFHICRGFLCLPSRDSIACSISGAGSCACQRARAARVRSVWSAASFSA